MRSSKLKKQSRAARREDALLEQLQACSNERDLLVQQQQQLLDERDSLYRVLQMQAAVTDVITGLLNRQAMLEQLEEALIGYRQTGGSCALLFVDLDHFKRINDRWGHRAGDALLHAIAQQMRMAVRPQDVVGRYGGEEFLILLPGVDVPAAIQTAKYLCSVLGSHSYYWQPSDGSVAVAISTTISIGIAVYPLHGISAENLLEIADRAMYQAKYTGRNRVYLADVEMTSQQSLHNQREYLAVQALAAAASIHDRGTQAHAQRLAYFIEATACQLKRSEEEIHLLRLAALLHDIGKIGIPETILHKPGPLTDEEWAIMHQHPELGRQMLEQLGGIFGELAQIVGTHHERWDGQGYPNGLAQEAIPMSARILAVVDAYDAMISPRPYRPKPLTNGEAITELQRSAGRQYDPYVIEAFLSVLAEQEKLPGPWVEAKATGTSDQPIPTQQGLSGEVRPSIAEIREQIAEIQQQQIALQQRKEAWQQQQIALQQRKEAWQQHPRIAQQAAKK